MEVWKDIPGYDYKVSNLGNVRRNNSQLRSLKPVKHKNGYVFVTLCNKQGKKACSIHRLVANAFIPNPDEKEQVNHKNGIKDDNRVENLEWVTPSENLSHCFKVLGRKNGGNVFKPGMIQKTRKFTDEQVRQIRDDDRTISEIARVFRADRKTIRAIKARKTYREVYDTGCDSGTVDLYTAF